MRGLFVLFAVAAFWSAVYAQPTANAKSTELDPALDGKNKTLEGTAEVRSLIEEMKTASLVNVNDTGVVGMKKIGTTRIFGNPFSWLEKKIPDKCHCSGRSCSCCFHIPVLDVEGCIGVKQPLFSSSVRLNLGVNQQTIVTVNIKFNKVERQCGWMPVPFKYLNFCIAERFSQAADGTISICPALEVRHDKTVGLSMMFNCIKFKGHFFMGAVPEIDPDAVVSIRVLNPFKDLVAKYKGQKS